jgi:H+/Cl- antiporter ClcA
VVRHLARPATLLVAAAASGAVAGLASFVFLESLDRVTTLRLDHPWLVWFLPAAGLAIGWAYDRAPLRVRGGTARAVGEARSYSDGMSGWAAPMVLVGTLLGHLVGASVGREGTAVQMSSSLTDAGARRFGLEQRDRALVARAALAGGFGSVFGVPVAGVVFALEASRRRSISVIVTAVVASFVGDAVVRSLGHDHAERVRVSLDFGWTTAARLVAAGVALGLLARLFVIAVASVRRATVRLVGTPALRPALGGAITLGAIVLIGRDHLGLSLPLIDASVAPLSPAGLNGWDPLLKLALTAVALGSGFVGGEVTPLFVVGATAGALVADPLGLPAPALGALGLVVVFSAAAHAPFTGIVLAVELFGGGALVPAVLVCAAARLVAHRSGLYDGGAGTERAGTGRAGTGRAGTERARRFSSVRARVPGARGARGSDRRST